MVCFDTSFVFDMHCTHQHHHVDMTNHHNKKLNMKHVFNPYKDDIKKTGYAIATTQSISSGEELFNSYNQCNVCQEYQDWFATPDLFKSYGFIEQYPQRWLFDLCRIKFDLDIDNESGVETVNFLVAPSKRGMEAMRKELERLDAFSKQYRSKNDVDIPDHEWKSLWEYYDALRNAIARALESDVPISDEVWEMPHNWWVTNGTMQESDQDSHFVRRSNQSTCIAAT